MVFINGDIYDGDWNNNIINGRGVMIYINGDKYDGEWKNGKREGKGVLTYAIGDVYEGDWKQDKFNGLGAFTRALTAERWEGQFKDGFKMDNGVRVIPSTGERLEEKEEISVSESNKPDYKESILARVKQHTTTTTTRDSSLSSLNRKPNGSLSKAIEDIKRKNAGTQ